MTISRQSQLADRFESYRGSPGRAAARADIDALSAILMGAGHRLFADRTGAPPDAAAAARMVTAVVAA